MPKEKLTKKNLTVSGIESSDLIREGMMKEHKHKKWIRGSEYLVNYSIEEPIHVIIGGKLYQEGDYTEPTEVDYG